MSQHLLIIVSLISCVQCCAPGGGGGRPMSNVTDSELVERARSLAQAGVCAQVSRGGPPRSRVVRRQAGGQCGVVSVIRTWSQCIMRRWSVWMVRRGGWWWPMVSPLTSIMTTLAPTGRYSSHWTSEHINTSGDRIPMRPAGLPATWCCQCLLVLAVIKTVLWVL